MVKYFFPDHRFIIFERLLKKRCMIFHAGGLGVSPSFKKSPKLGGLGGSVRLFQQSL